MLGGTRKLPPDYTVQDQAGREEEIVLNIGDDKWRSKQTEWSDKQLTEVITRENTSHCSAGAQCSLINTGMSTLQLWRPQSGFCLQLPQLMTSSTLNREDKLEIFKQHQPRLRDLVNIIMSHKNIM